MIIAIGTTNPIKIQAVEETLKTYPQLEAATIHAFAAPSEVAEQPLSIQEIILGAQNRARHAFNAWESCHYSFGIESGLFPAPGTQTGFLEACICCIYDGVQYYTGLSCGFEIPPDVLARVLNQQRDLNQACHEAGMSPNPKLGSAEGIIGLLTKGRISRKEYTKQCVIMALIQIENRALYAS